MLCFSIQLLVAKVNQGIEDFYESVELLINSIQFSRKLISLGSLSSSSLAFGSNVIRFVYRLTSSLSKDIK